MPRLGFLLLIPLALFRPLHSQAGDSMLIVIDPGHGGNDLGTTFQIGSGAGSRKWAEKDLTLLLAKKFAEVLRERDHRVVLTRTTDEDIPVTDRTQVANRLKADLFVSLHLNSMPPGSRVPEGLETYVLNNATDRGSKRLADLENAVLKGSVAKTQGESSDVSLILKDLILDANSEKSRRLACLVQEGLLGAYEPKFRKKKDRGVKQALFYVLLGADMPSVLVELGFLAHPLDRGFLESEAGKTKLARGFADALERFRSPKPVSCKVR